MNIRDIIIESFAKALHACAWADCVEEWGIENLSGCEILDVMDPVTATARDTARVAVEQIEKQNGMLINIAYEIAAAKPLEHGWEIQADPSDFGHYLGMEWLGHGVTWSDDHPNHDLKMSHGEFYYFHPSEFGREGNAVDVFYLTTDNTWYVLSVEMPSKVIESGDNETITQWVRDNTNVASNVCQLFV